MDIPFKAIAFELKYGSYQIDSIYAALDILNREEQKIPVFLLQSYKGYLPEDFVNYLSKIKDTKERPVNIIFEQHTIPKNVYHGDWDLINYD